MDDHKITFGTLQPDGQMTNVRLIKQADIVACPHYIMVPTHYRPDGSCKCDDADERAMMIREWGYSPDDFKGPVRTKFTDVTTGIQWDCSSCPAWGLSPNKDGAKAEAAKHSCREHIASFDDGFCCCYVGTGGHCPTCHGEEANS